MAETPSKYLVTGYRFHHTTSGGLFAIQLKKLFWTRVIWDSEPAVLNQHIFRVDIDPNRGYPIFILHAINRQLDVLINRAHGGVGLRHVTRKEVDTLEIALPPLAEQKRIALILSNQFAGAERVVQKIQQEVETINALPAALLQRAFTGGL